MFCSTTMAVLMIISVLLHMVSTSVVPESPNTEQKCSGICTPNKWMIIPDCYERCMNNEFPKPSEEVVDVENDWSYKTAYYGYNLTGINSASLRFLKCRKMCRATMCLISSDGYYKCKNDEIQNPTRKVNDDENGSIFESVFCMWFMRYFCEQIFNLG